MRTTARVIGGWTALRQAMADEGMTLAKLSNAAKLADPAGKGVSVALLGFLTQNPELSRHARPTCSPASAVLIEDALHRPRGTLFEEVEVDSRDGASTG